MNESDRQELARYGVATVYEAAGRTGLIDIPLVQLIPGSRVAGPARTVRCANTCPASRAAACTAWVRTPRNGRLRAGS